MSISPISSAATLQAETHKPVSQVPATQPTSTVQPAYTVSLSAAAHKAAAGDADRDGDSH